MARSLGDMEELSLCPSCKRAFHEVEQCGARRLADELARLARRRRRVLLRALDAAAALQLRLEAELAAPLPSPPLADLDRLRDTHAEALLHSRLDDIVCSASEPLDFDRLRRALAGLAPPEPPPTTELDPLLLLGNYCAARLFARQLSAGEGGNAPLVRSPGPFPLVFLEVSVGGGVAGRVVVALRCDVAPRMARNFLVLAAGGPGARGAGYRGCSVFQCWRGESVITGDFELNNGRGGRSAFDEPYFMPDDSRLPAVRGAVGMRRSQKRHDKQGLVGSQFRIVLREMRGFTAIFAFVAEGLELVDRLSRIGDSAGKPHTTIVISNCGKLN